MSYRISMLPFLFITAVLPGQNLRTVKEYKFKNFKAYVFTKEHNHSWTWDIKDKADYLTPDSSDVVKAEQEILKQKTFDSIKRLQKGLAKFHRQYLGYHSRSGDSILIISFINTNKGKKGKELKKSLDRDLIIGFGDWYEKNTFRLTYNLTTNKLSVY